MSKKHARDAIEELIEWEEHMYNPGYWINRFTPFFPPKPSKWTGILALIDVVIFVPTAISMIWLAIVQRSTVLAILAAVYTVFVVVATLRLWRLWPNKQSMAQRERKPKATMVRVKREKKKYPKRRKDYT